jgi:hypothetical protein
LTFGPEKIYNPIKLKQMEIFLPIIVIAVVIWFAVASGNKNKPVVAKAVLHGVAFADWDPLQEAHMKLFQKYFPRIDLGSGSEVKGNIDQANSLVAMLAYMTLAKNKVDLNEKIDGLDDEDNLLLEFKGFKPPKGVRWRIVYKRDFLAACELLCVNLEINQDGSGKGFLTPADSTFLGSSNPSPKTVDETSEGPSDLERLTEVSYVKASAVVKSKLLDAVGGVHISPLVSLEVDTQDFDLNLVERTVSLNLSVSNWRKRLVSERKALMEGEPAAFYCENNSRFRSWATEVGLHSVLCKRAMKIMSDSNTDRLKAVLMCSAAQPYGFGRTIAEKFHLGQTQLLAGAISSMKSSISGEIQDVSDELTGSIEEVSEAADEAKSAASAAAGLAMTAAANSLRNSINIGELKSK